MACRQDDAECEPFASCRDASGKCVKCCDPEDSKDVCLGKLEVACNSNAVPFGKSPNFTCVGFGYAPPGNPGLLKQACYNWRKSSSKETFYFKPGYGPRPPGVPTLFPAATSEQIRVVGRTARSSAASTSLWFDWPSTTIVAKMTGPATVLFNESSNATSPQNPKHGPTEVANSYWITLHPACCDWDDSHCKPNLSYDDVGGKCLLTQGIRLNTTALVKEYPLLPAGATATVRIEKITEAREDAGGVVEFVGLKAAALHAAPAPEKRRLIECVGDSIMCGAHTERGPPFPDTCNGEHRGNRESSHLSWCPTMARTLGAEYQMECCSGNGLIYLDGADKHPVGNMPYKWQQRLFCASDVAGKTTQDSRHMICDGLGGLEPLDTSAPPQAFVVDLGSNDYLPKLHLPRTEQ